MHGARVCEDWTVTKSRPLVMALKFWASTPTTLPRATGATDQNISAKMKATRGVECWLIQWRPQ